MTKDWKTTTAGILVAVLGAVASSPVGHPFSQSVHDWATLAAFLCAGLGFHAAADAASGKPTSVEVPPTNEEEASK